MKKLSIRLLLLASFAIATIDSPLAYAAGDDNPAPPAKGKKKDDKSSSIDSPASTLLRRPSQATAINASSHSPNAARG